MIIVSDRRHACCTVVGGLTAIFTNLSVASSFTRRSYDQGDRMAYKRLIIATLCLLLLAVLLPGCGSAGGASVDQADGVKMVSRTAGNYFQVYDGSWQGHLVKGVNIGASIPGHWFGELAISQEMYLRWMEDISRMHANTILVYTLLDPKFYAALDDFNRAHPDTRLWIIQQVWPSDEGVLTNLYLSSYVTAYKKELALCASALMGKINIPERPGESWGKFTRNVMPYVMGIIVGRELTMAEARDTDASNPQITGHNGRFVMTIGPANAVESWCAEMADTMATKISAYGWQVPVGYVSWPTLDPMVHPTENTPDQPKWKEVDDSQVLDPRHLAPGPDAKAGLFGVFQIYPYYPEFMYRQPSYAQYTDSQGILRYGGYLKEFRAYVPGYPALVGEFGLPTSVSCAHQQPEGLSQGAINETTQGTELSRLYRAAVREGYAGGLVFEWADEWAKRSWTTMSYMVPFDRHILWHNVTDPEQCFGLMAFESKGQPSEKLRLIWKNPSGGKGQGQISAAYSYSDDAFVYLGFDIQGASGLLPGNKAGLALNVGISVLGKGHGTTRLPVPGLPDLPIGAEFLLQINGDSSAILNRPDYSRATSKFWAASSTDTVFEPVIYVINREQIATDGTYFPIIWTNQSRLKYGDFNRGSSQFDSLGNWYVDAARSRVVIRLPWGLLNVSDPSSNRVILDDTKGFPPGPAGMRNMALDTLSTVKTPGFQFFASTTAGGSLGDFGPRKAGSSGFDTASHVYTWRGWNSPSYEERLKLSYSYMQKTYGSFSSSVPPVPQP
jgi:hypothetical protein